MVLFLSMVVTITFPFQKNDKLSNKFLFSCLLLSLTHYFGLLYAGFMLAFVFFKNLKKRYNLMRVIITGLLCMIWPVNHLLNGTILEKTGGNFWYLVDGISGSFSLAASGFHFFPFGYRAAGFVLITGIIVVLIFSFYRINSSQKNNDALAVVTFDVSMIALIFIVTVALFDLYTPLSTMKNYIVLVPAISIIFAGMVCLIIDYFPRAEKYLMSAVLLYCLFSLLNSYKDLSGKAGAYQDWRNAFHTASIHSEGRQIYFLWSKEVLLKDGRKVNIDWSHHIVADHYCEKSGIKPENVNVYTIGTTRIKKPAVLIYGHINNLKEYDRFKTEMISIGARRIFPPVGPEDGYPAGVFLIK